MALCTRQHTSSVMIFVAGDRELASGNLNHLPVGAQQLTGGSGANISPPYPPSPPAQQPRAAVSILKRVGTGPPCIPMKTLQSHVFVWVHFLTQWALLLKGAAGQQSQPEH